MSKPRELDPAPIAIKAGAKRESMDRLTYQRGNSKEPATSKKTSQPPNSSQTLPCRFSRNKYRKPRQFLSGDSSLSWGVQCGMAWHGDHGFITDALNRSKLTITRSQRAQHSVSFRALAETKLQGSGHIGHI